MEDTLVCPFPAAEPADLSGKGGRESITLAMKPLRTAFIAPIGMKPLSTRVFALRSPSSRSRRVPSKLLLDIGHTVFKPDEL
jgi:hypothetical protein